MKSCVKKFFPIIGIYFVMCTTLLCIKKCSVNRYQILAHTVFLLHNNWSPLHLTLCISLNNLYYFPLMISIPEHLLIYEASAFLWRFFRLPDNLHLSMRLMCLNYCQNLVLRSDASTYKAFSIVNMIVILSLEH